MNLLTSKIGNPVPVSDKNKTLLADHTRVACKIWWKSAMNYGR